MNTPLASKTTVSSRNKMATGLNNHFHQSTTATAAKTTATTATANNYTSKIPPRTLFKPPLTKTERTTAALAATSSRIALSRSRLSGNSAVSTAAPSSTSTTTRLETATGLKNQRLGESGTVLNQRLPSSSLLNNRNQNASQTQTRTNSFANSRSSSKLSSISSSVNNNNYAKHNNNTDRSSSRQSPLAPHTQTTVKTRPANAGSGSIIPQSNYVPDTNAIRKGLAKFSNPMECQRQFQSLNSKLRELTDINENKDKRIGELQDQLKGALKHGLGYAITVQYFAKKLKIDDDVDLEEECEQLKSQINLFMKNECEFQKKLAEVSSEYESKLETERALKDSFCNQLDETRVNHSNELVRLNDLHTKHSSDLENRHQSIEQELSDRIQILETDLNARTKELHELRKEYDDLNTSFNKLEESLTRDKDARVKYAQEKSIQLQKDVDSLNSVLEMRNERIHALEKDSILLGEVKHELMRTEDNNKALKQQLESLNAALENKRVLYENLLAEHDRIAQELKRERRERRRMTMRTEQLEYVLNESCANENNITVLDSSVGT